ncbi:hypothetical protein KAFR_0A04650 [Kazachstania africana CBS 2517]|uniref:Mediator of RNA polymerase II transcription subunit 31 n=1 Tax=Kazachstania africana (strain ATCC 22294 / BCRC 22015 / CBS 2517 / CECT 1963 / NBRC 1671 / NRRL Y-8276) TaxID=1071382 RepID=H2ANF0_KAZAF|nr:hypothetical protein KAFR_0A04650 [Kazachstania africana CBS 2517]CCF55900.1 hypothetical protein KAFR_0A04650 [Kazachstania africana CBS 2517]
MNASEDTERTPTPSPPLPTRFEIELEFVQSLSNIQYITYLITNQSKQWKSVTFKNYLKYLEYWCDPPYANCVVYPNSLYILKLMNDFYEKNAKYNEETGYLENIDELPVFLQLHGSQLMNEMVNRWQN